MRWVALLSVLVFGLGAGMMAGRGDPGSEQLGVILAALGLCASLVSISLTRSDARSSDDLGPINDGGRPTLAGLGTRVEEILKLAEEQAADHRAQAQAEADRIIADARDRARGIAGPAGSVTSGTADPQGSFSSAD
jgi:hypothetical protein